MPSGFKVNSYQELQDCINALPPPAEGKVRVFRGQDFNWPLLPSGRRRPLPRAEIWSHYLRRLVMYIERSGVYEDLDREFQIWFVWLQALAQHYGSGSNYLDVSHDLGVATWFAFHKLKTAKLETVVGPPDTTDQDSIEKTEWLRVLPHTGPGYVYALDLTTWNGEGTPEAGEMVDLGHSPKIFHSKRIEVQSGCLVYADENQDLGKEYLVPGTPIEMTTGFDQSPYASWTVENIFPSAAEDHWYARFLRLPFLLTPETGKEATLQQSLPIQLFLSSPDSPYVTDIRSRFTHLLPAHIFSSLSVEPSKSKEWWSKCTPENAAVVALEGPQISAHPPVEYESWNHELLMSDFASEAEVFEIGRDQPAATIKLDSVIFEFSPLEVAWEEGESHGELLRAMWIVRSPAGDLAAFLFYQDYPGFSIAQAGPVLLRLGSESHRLEWRAPSKSQWSDISELAPAAKAIISCLVILRDLSPEPKFAAYPSLVTDAGSDQESSVVLVSSAPARLFRATVQDAPRQWYVLRHPNGEPYTIAKPNIGTLTLKSSRSFGQMTAAELKQLLMKSIGGKANVTTGSSAPADSVGT